MAATLGLYRAGLAVREIPVWRAIAARADDLRARAEALVARLDGPGDGVRVVALASTVGGGALPGETLPSWGSPWAIAPAVRIRPRSASHGGSASRGPSAETLLGRLRAGDPAVVGRIEEGLVVLDLRTVDPSSRPRPRDRDRGRPGSAGAGAALTVVIGTAGHIDHGKTSLLRALTGIDADRLPEERRRGMTIDVGYAHLDLPDGTTIDFVDVPGHDRLVGNMLVGAGEIDAALLVVAADDGPRAQTWEHLELLDALGIRHGLVARDEGGRRRRGQDRGRGRRRPGAGRADEPGRRPVLAVASPSGEGIAELRSALLELRDRVLDEGASGTPAARAWRSTGSSA